jgi:hypothetical protein
MVEHHPGILQIFPRLHMLHQIYPTTRPDFGHLEDKNLVKISPLTGKFVLLNKGL